MKSIVQNVINLLLSTILSRVLFAATLIILAQYLNAEQYGMFSVALAFSMVMGFFTDVGISNTFVREGSKNRANIVNLISSYIKLRLLLLFATFLICVAIIELFYQKEGLREVLYYMFIPMITGLAMQNISITYFQLIERMHYAGLIRIWSSVGCILLIALGMALKFPVTVIALLFGLSYVLAGVYSLWILTKNTRINLGCTFEKLLLHQLAPFVVSGLLMMLLPQLGPLVLEKTLVLHYVGVFAIAYRIPSALYQVPGVVAGAFYPVLFRYWSSGDAQKHLNLNLTQIKVMGLMGIVITIPLFHMSAEVILLLFGKEWIAAAEPMRILSIVLFLQSISFALADGLTTKGLQTRRTIVQFLTVLLGVVTYYTLSLTFGLTGAAYSVIIIESFAILCFWFLNPSRLLIGKKVLVPYLLIAIMSLFLTAKAFGQIPLLSIALNLLIILVFATFDVEIRDYIKGCINIGKNQPQYKMKEERL